MTVCIVHYHLGPGGVAQVITSASRVLTEAGIAHVILVGNAASNIPSDLPLRVVWVHRNEQVESSEKEFSLG